MAGSPELSGGVVHDQMSVALFQARLGSAKVSDGDSPLGITWTTGRRCPSGAAAHLEPGGLAEREAAGVTEDVA